jgi:chemosensory pili system protein ChpA (sensor histidine kinase/response regulator)
MRRVRPRFHRGLVDWYRNAPDPRGLLRLETLFRKVNAGLGVGILADLFGLAETFAVVLRDGRLDGDAGMRSLMGQLDRVLRPLAQHPPVWPEDEARALIDRLLGLLEVLEPGDRRVVELAALYRSSEAIRLAQSARRDRAVPAREDDVDRTDGRLAEFVALEDLLELIDRGAFVDPAALDAAYAALHEVVGVLDPTDACRLASRLAAIADQVKALMSAEAIEQSIRLEALAADLLALESILQAWVDAGAVAEAPSLGSGKDPAKSTFAALRELDRELLGVTELLFGRGIEDMSMRSDAAWTMLARIAGVLRLLGLSEAADLAAVCGDRMRRQNTVRDPRSVDVGREGVAEALDCLRREIDAGLAAGPVVPAQTGCAKQALIALAHAIEQASAPTMPLGAPNGMPSDVPSLPCSPALAEERIAPELMEIFLEEIDEEIASARERLARWSLDPRDAAAVTGLKRNFSVVKGSGLLVGARRVAEVAEAVEGLLVRVTAQSTRDPAATSFIAEVLDQLPALVHGGAEDRASVVKALVARAEQIAEAAPDTGVEVDGLSALVPLVGLTGAGDAPQIPIEDLLDTFEAAPETPGEWVLPDLDESRDTESGDSLEAATLAEQIAEIARCRAELDITHTQLVSGLDILDLGLARLRDLVDRLASDPHPSERPLGEAVDDMGDALWPRVFCGRVGEILDDLESIRRGLIADRQASDELRARQAKLLEAVSDALLKLDLESSDGRSRPL